MLVFADPGKNIRSVMGRVDIKFSSERNFTCLDNCTIAL